MRLTLRSQPTAVQRRQKKYSNNSKGDRRRSTTARKGPNTHDDQRQTGSEDNQRQIPAQSKPEANQRQPTRRRDTATSSAKSTEDIHAHLIRTPLQSMTTRENDDNDSKRNNDRQLQLKGEPTTTKLNSKAAQPRCSHTHTARCSASQLHR